MNRIGLDPKILLSLVSGAGEKKRYALLEELLERIDHEGRKAEYRMPKLGSVKRSEWCGNALCEGSVVRDTMFLGLWNNFRCLRIGRR